MTEKRIQAWPERFSDALRLRLWWLLAIALLLVALYVVVARQLMSMAADFREPLESYLVERLDIPLEIGSLSGRMEGLGPVFELERVRIPQQGDEEGTPLELERVELRVAVLHSLIHRTLRLEELRVQGAAIHLRRTPEGTVRLRGLEEAGLGAGEGFTLRTLLEPVYRQQRLVLEDVRAIIDWPGLPRMQSDDLALEMVTSGVRHHLAVRFTMADRPLAVDGRIHMSGDAYRLEHVDGRGYLRMAGEGLEYWLPAARDGALHPEEVSGNLELWGQVRNGRLREATMRLAAREVLLAHDEADRRWSLANLEARARLRQQRGGYQLDLERLFARTGTGALEAGPVSVQWQRDQDLDTVAWRLRAAGLDLSRLREQLMAWPFPLSDEIARVRETLGELAPGGLVRDFHLAGSNRTPEYMAARVEALRVATEGERPGVARLSGWISGTPDEGVVRVDSDALVVHLPGQFPDPLIAALNGPLHWKRDERDRLVLSSGRMQLDSPDARAEALFSLHMAPDEVPELRLRALVRDGVAANAARYIPLEYLDDGLSNWLANAFHGGRVQSGRVLYEGPVRIDPGRQQDRTQQMIFDVEDARLHFADHWPLLEEATGRVMLDGRDVTGEGLSGRLHRSRMSDARFSVPEVPEGEAPVLQVDGHVDGPMVDLDAILRDTPLSRNLPEAFGDWALRDGYLDAALALELPLAESEQETVVRAEGRIHGAELYSRQHDLAAQEISGNAEFSLSEGLRMPLFTGRFMGSPVLGSIASDADRVRVSLGGELHMDSLREHLDWPRLAALGGSTLYGASLEFSRQEGGGQPELAVHSQLEGLSVEAPSPLGKGAGEVLPLRVLLRGGRDGARELTLDYGDRLAGALEFDEGALRRGHLRFAGQADSLREEPGLYLDGAVASLDLDAWLDFLAGPEKADNALTGLEQVELDLDIDDLKLWGLHATQSRLRANRSGDSGWTLSLESPSILVDATVPVGYRVRGEEPMELDIRRLHIDTGDGEYVEAEGERFAGLDPRVVPVANVKLGDIRVSGQGYGRWEAGFRPLDNGVRMEGLTGRWRHARIHGQLDWVETEEGQTSHFEGEVKSDDLAETLKAWDIPPFIESADANTRFDVTWPGTPLDFDYLALQGNAHVEIHDCLLPSRDRRTSALQVLGLVNISNITRRLRLDFSDVFRRGLSCDRLRGMFSLDGPMVSTGRLAIRSPQANFVISGSMDIEARTLDHEMEIVLPLSSNLYAGCLAGPAACAGIFMVERLWGDRLERYTTLEYRVTGSWDDPDIEETRGLLER